MRKFLITTDGNSDLTEAYGREHQIRLIPLYYNMDGRIYGGDDVLPPEDFYNMMRAGKMPTTMAVNPEVVEKTFRSVLEDMIFYILPFRQRSVEVIMWRPWWGSSLRRRSPRQRFLS